MVDNNEITNAEKALLEQYQNLSETIPSLVNRLAIEVVPPVVFFIAWMFTGKVLFLLVCMAIMVLYNIQRVLRQYKNIVILHSISKKIIGETTDEKKT